ncbi:MAG: alpha/beta fold hydrolase, partial [Proteobacteria bacterium]|nr:alpha/beta fold hydrolase [Pseudomonadota bacterium]
HLVSFAGYAGKPPIAGPLHATARADLVAYIRDRQLDHPILVGHSLGGFFAFWVAVTEPDLVGPIVNLDATPNFYADASVLSLRTKADQWLAQGKAEFADTLRNYYNGMSRDRKRLGRVIEDVVRSDQHAYVESFMEMAKYDLVAKVPVIKSGVLSVLSDGAYFYEFVKQQTAKIRDAKTVMLKDTRHFVFFDDQPGFFRALDAFLAAHPAAAPR